MGWIQWAAILVPVLFAAILELVVYVFYPALLSWPGRFVLAAVVVVGMVLFYGGLFSLIRRMNARLERRNRELLALHEQLRKRAVAEERVRVSSDMHEDMSQVLAWVNTKAQVVKSHIEGGRPAKACNELEDLAAAARTAFDDSRLRLAGLRAAANGAGDLRLALEELVSQWQDETGIAGSLEVDGGLQLSPLTQLQVIQIAQEALANIRKHAEARNARITFSESPSHTVISIEDDGSGFEEGAMSRMPGLPRLGLPMMRQRAESIGGTLVLESKPGMGTRLRVEIPHEAGA